MTAYLIVMAEVFDADGLRNGYGKAVLPLLKKFGGRYLVRGGKPEGLEGETDTRRTIIVEFPTMEALRAFWGSSEYAEVKKLRGGLAKLDVWAMPGTDIT